MFLKISQSLQKPPAPESFQGTDLRLATLLKRDSGTDVFLWILRNFCKTYPASGIAWVEKRHLHSVTTRKYWLPGKSER